MKGCVYRVGRIVLTLSYMTEHLSYMTKVFLNILPCNPNLSLLTKVKYDLLLRLKGDSYFPTQVRNDLHQ